MMQERRYAYSYVRFSTPEQAQGDSHRRQIEAARAYAREHKLVLDDTLTFEDRGVSGFKGKNVETGQLGLFKRCVEEGLVAKGSVLIVESLDRISRQAARKAVRTLEDIVDQGVTVVSLSDRRAYTQESLERDPTAFMLAFLTFIRANEESEMKSMRLKAAWAAKRARGTPLTARTPAWLRLNKASGRFEVLKDRAAIVARIYKMAAQGYGQHAIAEALNSEGVPTFGDSTRRRAVYWHRSYIAKLLASDAPSGRFTPHRLEHHEGKKRRVPEEPVEGYFPAIVSPEIVERVRSLRSEGTTAPRQRNAGARPIASFLARLVRCGRCGAAMMRVNKGERGGRPYLVCSRVKAGAVEPRRCTMPAMRLHPWEMSIALYMAREAKDVRAGSVKELEEEIDALEERLAKADHALSALVENLERTQASPALIARFNKREAEKAALAAKLNDLLAKLEARAPRLVKRNLDECRNFFAEAVEQWEEYGPDSFDGFDHLGANAALRRAVERIVLRGPAGKFTVQWKHGMETEGSAPGVVEWTA